MVSKLFNLLGLTALALIASTHSVLPAAALSSGGHHLNRQLSHEAIAKRNNVQRSNSRRCKPRPSASSSLSSSSASSTQAPKTTSQSHTTVSHTSSAAAHTSPPATSPITPPSVGTGSGNGGGGKIGLAWPNGPSSDLANFVNDNVGWIYSWSPYNPDPDNKYKVQFMPQLWGESQTTDFESAVPKSGNGIILGFNEPNEGGQSNMSPSDGVSLWKQHITSRAQNGWKTCSPATSSNPNGLKWVQDFQSQCGSDCDFDYVCVHWYDTTFEKFQTYVELWHTTFGKDIFITEFAPQNFNGGGQLNADQIQAFYQQAMSWIMETDYIKGAFPYGFMANININPLDQLMGNTNGQPNALGSYILGGKY